MKPLSVLILDDDPVVGHLLMISAKAAGAQAHWVQNLADLIAQLDALAPTHLVLDLTLPDASYEAVIAALAAARCRAQVIVCSGRSTIDLESALTQARQAGMTTAGVLNKPFRQAEFRSLLAA